MHPSDVTQKIKDLRSKKGLSLAQLARLTGYPKGHLSKIENSENVPKISTLQKIATALGVDLVYLFSNNHINQVNTKIIINRIKNMDAEGAELQDSGIKFWSLANQKFGRNMDPHLVEIPFDHSWVFQFEGEEFNLLLEGKVELRYGGDRYILEKGDSVYIDGDIPYSAKSIGETTALLLAIIYRYKRITSDVFNQSMTPNYFKYNRASKAK